MDLQKFSWRALRCAPILLLVLGMSACGGGGGGQSGSPATDTPPVSTPPPAPTPAPPTTPNPTPPPSQGDTVAPTVTVSVTTDQDVITFSAMATDNVGVAEVLFLVDSGAIEGRVSERPSDGTYSWRIQTNLVGAGSHTVVARARDLAGNSADSSVATFTIGNPSGGTDTVPPTVTASESGNFGLIVLSATASDNVGVDGVSFLIDGQLVGPSANARNDGSYALVFDASGLADGNHTLVARAYDRRLNQADSEPVSFSIDSTAGVRESEPNNTTATANPLTADARLLTGLVEIDEVAGLPVPRDDYYRVNLAVGTSLRIDMLCDDPRFLLLRLEDASGAVLVPDNRDTAAKTIVYNNVDMPRDVYIHVSSTAAQLGERAKYNLSLSYP